MILPKLALPMKQNHRDTIGNVRKVVTKVFVSTISKGDVKVHLTTVATNLSTR